jgi:hypothetical protein|tara:strand:+ start:12206 stop:12328 length:123 start_codon:yes stop_codon:yes gene_type:complete
LLIIPFFQFFHPALKRKEGRKEGRRERGGGIMCNNVNILK